MKSSFKLGTLFSMLVAFALVISACGGSNTIAAQVDPSSIKTQIEKWAQDHNLDTNKEMIVVVGIIKTIPADLAPFSPAIVDTLGLMGAWYTFVDWQFPAEQREQALMLIYAHTNFAVMTVKQFIANEVVKASTANTLLELGYKSLTFNQPLFWDPDGVDIGYAVDGHELFHVTTKADGNGGCDYSGSFLGVQIAGHKDENGCDPSRFLAWITGSTGVMTQVAQQRTSAEIATKLVTDSLNYVTEILSAFAGE